MNGIVDDLRHAFRQIVRAPVMSGVAVLILTVGIATTAVVFATLDGVLFRPPPGVGTAEGLVEVERVRVDGQRSWTRLSHPEFQALRSRTDVFEKLAVYEAMSVPLRVGEGIQLVLAEFASSAYFDVLDVRMERGSGFTHTDGGSQADGAAHAVLGYAFWQTHLGGSEDVVGRRVEVGEHTFTVIGVAPERFYGAGGGDDPVALWLPLSQQPGIFPAGPSLLEADPPRFVPIGRLADGLQPARGEALALEVVRRVAAGTASGEGATRIRITPYRGVGSNRLSSAGSFLALMGGLIGGSVLLIACANVSGLLVSRAVRRRREIGVRMALGGGRGRLVRQLLTESLVLAGIAGVTGTAVAFLSLDLLARSLFTFPLDLVGSPRILLPILVVTFVSGVVFGLTPALHGTRVSVSRTLKDDVAGVGRGSSRLRDGITVAQLGLSLPLLTAAGLLVAQVVLQQTRWGWGDPEGVVAYALHLGHAGYHDDEVDPLLTRIRGRVAAMPGVSEAAFASTVPYVAQQWSAGAYLPDPERDPDRRFPDLRLAAIDPEYFDAMGVPLRLGRPLQASDGPGAPRVIVVDESVARRAWPDQDPLGRSLTLVVGEEEMDATVVGVSGSSRTGGGASYENGVVFAPRRQLPVPDRTVLVVGPVSGAGAALASDVRAELMAIDPDLVVNVRGLEASMRGYARELRHVSAGAVACGLLALILACVGLYGAIATRVTDRRREIGVRLALGANGARITRHFVRQGLVLALVALAVGIPLSWATIAVVGSRVVGVGPMAPAVAAGLGGVGLLMIAVATTASWLPARLSASVDPVRSLRTE